MRYRSREDKLDDDDDSGHGSEENEDGGERGREISVNDISERWMRWLEVHERS